MVTCTRVNIVYYSSHILPPSAIRTVYGTKLLEQEHIPYEEARKEIWKLVKAGGERNVEINPFDPAICYVSAMAITENP